MCKDVHIIYFKGRNFRDFGLFSRKLLPGKKLEEKFAKVIFAKKKTIPKLAKVFSKFEKSKIRRENKEKCRNNLVLMYAFKTDNKTNISKMLR